MFVLACASLWVRAALGCGASTSETDASAGGSAADGATDATARADAIAHGDGDTPTDASTRDASTDAARDGDLRDARSSDASDDVVTSDAADGASDADAAPTSDPGRVECGGTTCRTDIYEECCTPPSVDGGTDGVCTTSPSNCHPRTQCDERADCYAGTVCCAGPTSSAAKWIFDSVCLSASANVCEFNGGFQLCKTDAECGGGACTAKSCAGRRFFSCGALPAWLTCDP